MTISADENFLKKHRIEFPEPSALTVFHAEPVTLIQRKGYTFSNVACDLIRDLISDRGQTVDQFLKSVASDRGAPRHTVIFFLDGPYHIAEHIWAIRSSIKEIAMVSCTTPSPLNLEVPPPAGALFIADVPTLAMLGQRSPFLGQLLQIADGLPDDEIWAYFLGKADRKEEEAEEGIEIPVGKIELVTK
jgi:hypothetical protein